MTEYAEQCLQRMEALVRKMAANAATNGFDSEFQSEARAIVAEIDRPKSDEEWAAEIVGNDWEAWTAYAKVRVICAIAKGRELERAMYVVCGGTVYKGGSHSVYKRIDEASAVEPC